MRYLGQLELVEGELAKRKAAIKKLGKAEAMTGLCKSS